jgi:dihydropteroate synthase-like protein
VSIDTFDPSEAEAAAEAGAELWLSAHAGTLDAVRSVDCEVVVIPQRPRDADWFDDLQRSIDRLDRWGVRYRVDPVIEPIGSGFAASLQRYALTRERVPGVEMMMGIGNLTELTEVDSAGVNMMLAGVCQELGIRSVLTTEVIDWCRTAVRELDLARRLTHYALRHAVPPKHLDDRLVMLRDARVVEHGSEALAALAEQLRDRNYRIFAEGGRIHVMNADVNLTGNDPFELFDQLRVTDASHAFYLGYEMAKAVTALTLGKQYRQDEALDWGFLTVPEHSHVARHGGKHVEPPREARDDS